MIKHTTKFGTNYLNSNYLCRTHSNILTYWNHIIITTMELETNLYYFWTHMWALVVKQTSQISTMEPTYASKHFSLTPYIGEPM